MFTAPTPSITDKLTEAIDAALVSHRKAEYEKGRGSGSGDVAAKRIGSGYIGVECARQLAFRYHKWPKEERDSVVSPGELQRHAEAGFWTEGAIAEWLRLAGFDIRTHKDNGKQFGWMAAKDENGQARMAGEIDGVILSGPVDLPYPVLWESKKAAAKKFAQFVKLGVKGADSKYYGQLQTNHVFMEVPNTLFSMLNLDNMKFYFELVPFDAPVAQQLQDRAARVLSSADPFELPPIANDECDFRCKFCDFRGACFGKKTHTQSTTFAPTWLNTNTPSLQTPV